MKMRLMVITVVILLTGFLPSSMGLAAPQDWGGGIHVVQWGENLATIAARYATTVEAIAQANGIPDQNYVYIGQELLVPAPASLQGPSMDQTMTQAMPETMPQTMPQTMGQNLQAPLASGQLPVESTVAGPAYTVKFGDTLTSIALRHGTTINDIMRSNGLAGSTIYIGQQLAIPGATNAPVQPAPAQASPGPTTPYSVKQGDTLSSIAFRHGSTVNDIMQVNSLHSSSIFPGQQLAIPGGLAIGMEQPAGTFYSVQPGDTLAGIALRYGTTLPAILQANNLSRSQFIFPGQEIVIPGRMNLPGEAAAVTMPPQMALGPDAMSASVMSAPSPETVPLAPAAPSQGGQMMPSQATVLQQAPVVAPNLPVAAQSMSAPMVPPMIAPNVAGPPAPAPMPPIIIDNDPFLDTAKDEPPLMTTQWNGSVVSQTHPDDWNYPSVLRVNVGGAKGMQVTVRKKGGPTWSTTGFTGTKPEYGDGAVEFAPLNTGKHVVSLDGQGKGSTLTVDIKPNSLTYVEFVRETADTGPYS